MLRNRLLALVICFACIRSAYDITITINIDSAKAVLGAIQNPALSHNEAMKIAQMYGNQGAIRKLNEFKIPATTESFAKALYAEAHGDKVTDPAEADFLFDMVKPKAPQLLALIQQIEANPQTFQAAIEQRIAMFTPSNADIHLNGYVVAAGDGGGYAFGTTDFYLNVGIIDEFVVAKGVTTHELYHAVQGAFAKDRELPAGSSLTTQSHAQRACATSERLFANVYEEGSAVEVEDISLLSEAHSAIGLRKRTDLTDGLKHIHTSVSLLEMSVVSLSADDPVPYANVYDVGFYGHAILYNIGYVMAKAIADNDGPQGLTMFLKQPPYKFVQRYMQLPKYGVDKDHPTLGPNTVVAVSRLADGCKNSYDGQ